MIQRALFCAMTACVLMVIAHPASGADLARGKALYEENCSMCHAGDYYPKKTKWIVRSLEKLRARVEYCQNEAGAEWDEGQIEDVAAYLNATYYHFK